MKIMYRQKNPIKNCRVVKIKIIKKTRLISITLLYAPTLQHSGTV
jgi:hypothetical protein